MANLIAPFGVYPQGAGPIIQHGIATFSSQSSAGDNVVHIKTAIPKAQIVMATIEAVGYNYNAGQGIRCSWSFASIGSLLSGKAYNTVYPGMTPLSVYYSTDNFVALRGNALAYFTGFTLNAYTANSDGLGYQIEIQDIHVNTNNTDYL